MSKKYDIGGDKFRVRRLGQDDPTDGAMTLPLEPRYFAKLPEGMEPQVWIRLKTTLAFFMPPDPKMDVYPMSFDDAYWSIHTQPVKTKGKDKIVYMLTYRYTGKHEEEGITAAMMFQQVVVPNAAGKRGYDILNLKYVLYDVQISQNVSIRLIPNPI